MKSRPIGTDQTILASHQNDKRDDGRGGSFLLAHQQLGALALPTEPTNGQVIPIVINGTTITVTAVTTIGSTANNVLIDGSALAFVTNLLNFLRRPDLTTSTQVAASSATQLLLQYVGWAWPGSSTTIVPFSLNKNVNGITGGLTSFNITGMTVTSGTWTAQTMQLYIEDGTYYIGGARYLFTGSSTSTVTAPVSHPRVDVLSIDNTGTLNWTTGTEASSPVAPAYPANQVPICELYNVVGEIALYDNENQQSGEGYIANDVRPTMNYGIPFGAVPDDILPDTTNTRSLGSSGNQWLNIYGKNIYNNGALVAATKFGGTGANGALSITSGTVTINLSNAPVTVLNYSSISITGSGSLAFSNPSTSGSIVVLKSTGNVTITSSAAAAINVSNLGSTGDGIGLITGPTQTRTSTVYGSFVTSGGSQVNLYIQGRGVYNAATINGKGVNVFAGAAGTNGTTNGGSSGTNGTGGQGGGGLYIECGGTLDFTGTINASGNPGGNATSGGTSVSYQTFSGDGGASNTDGTIGSKYQNTTTQYAPGGGGGGGSVCILYNFLTADSGMITVAGGVAGTGSAGGAQAGANGWSLVTQNTEFA